MCNYVPKHRGEAFRAVYIFHRLIKIKVLVAPSYSIQVDTFRRYSNLTGGKMMGFKRLILLFSCV